MKKSNPFYNFKVGYKVLSLTNLGRKILGFECEITKSKTGVKVKEIKYI